MMYTTIDHTMAERRIAKAKQAEVAAQNLEIKNYCHKVADTLSKYANE